MTSELKEKGWYLSPEGLDICKDGLAKITTAAIIQKALDIDLREIGGPFLSEEIYKNKVEFIIGPCVLQIQKIKNVCVPKYDASKNGPALLRLYLTDGVMTVSCLQSGYFKTISMDTAPGTKILLKNVKVPVQNGFLLLNENHFTILGGEVPALIEKWELAKRLASHVRRGDGADDGPPPWIPFGKPINYKEPKAMSGNFKSLEQEAKTQKEDVVFKQQRQATIAEVSKAKEGRAKVFGGGKEKPSNNQTYDKFSNNKNNYGSHSQENYQPNHYNSSSQRMTQDTNFNNGKFDYDSEKSQAYRPGKKYENQDKSRKFNSYEKMDDTKEHMANVQRNTETKPNFYNSSKNQDTNFHTRNQDGNFQSSRNQEMNFHTPNQERNPQSSRNQKPSFQNASKAQETNFQSSSRNQDQKGNFQSSTWNNDHRNTSRISSHSGEHNNSRYDSGRSYNSRNNSSNTSYHNDYKDNQQDTNNRKKDYDRTNKNQYANNEMDSLDKQMSQLTVQSPKVPFDEMDFPQLNSLQLKRGMEVMARYWEDKKFYFAIIHEVGKNGTCVVHFVEYGNYEEVHLSDIRPASTDSDKHHSAPSSSNNKNNYSQQEDGSNFTGVLEFRRGGYKPHVQHEEDQNQERFNARNQRQDHKPSVKLYQVPHYRQDQYQNQSYY